MISIIIPAYNAEKYIRQTIESAIGQTFADKEIIVVNDGSTDGTLDIVHPYADRGLLQLITYGYNRGAPHTYNAGLSHSRGEYVTFLDADDIFLPSYCEQVLGLMTDKGTDIGFANLMVMDGTTPLSGTLYGQPRDQRFNHFYGGPTNTFPSDPDLVRKGILQGVLISPRAIYRRTLFDRYGMEDPRFRIVHDWFRHVKFILNNARCGYLDEPLGFYRVHSEGNSQRDGMANLIENLRMFEAILSELPPIMTEEERVITTQIRNEFRKSLFHALASSDGSTSQVVQFLVSNHL